MLPVTVGLPHVEQDITSITIVLTPSDTNVLFVNQSLKVLQSGKRISDSEDCTLLVGFLFIDPVKDTLEMKNQTAKNMMKCSHRKEVTCFKRTLFYCFTLSVVETGNSSVENLVGSVVIISKLISVPSTLNNFTTEYFIQKSTRTSENLF